MKRGGLPPCSCASMEVSEPTMSAKAWIRAALPRPVRNFLRGPSASIRWAANNARALLGSAPRVQMSPVWDITCHPESHTAFEILKDIPETRAELDGFVQRCVPGMVFVDVGAHFGIFTLA